MCRPSLEASGGAAPTWQGHSAARLQWRCTASEAIKAAETDDGWQEYEASSTTKPRYCVLLGLLVASPACGCVVLVLVQKQAILHP
jgi:hypothetical protein